MFDDYERQRYIRFEKALRRSAVQEFAVADDDASPVNTCGWMFARRSELRDDVDLAVVFVSRKDLIGPRLTNCFDGNRLRFIFSAILGITFYHFGWRPFPAVVVFFNSQGRDRAPLSFLRFRTVGPKS
jgi:hypothetical protein